MITIEDFLKWAEMIDPTPETANAARSSAAFDPTPDPAAVRSSQAPSTSVVFDGDVYFDPFQPQTGSIEGGKRKSKKKKKYTLYLGPRFLFWTGLNPSSSFL